MRWCTPLHRRQKSGLWVQRTAVTLHRCHRLPPAAAAAPAPDHPAAGLALHGAVVIVRTQWAGRARDIAVVAATAGAGCLETIVETTLAGEVGSDGRDTCLAHHWGSPTRGMAAADVATGGGTQARPVVDSS